MVKIQDTFECVKHADVELERMPKKSLIVRICYDENLRFLKGLGDISQGLANFLSNIVLPSSSLGKTLLESCASS